MAKFAIIADCHIGPAKLPGIPGNLVDYVRIASLRKAYGAFSESGVDAVIIAGDLFDRVSLSPRFADSVNQCLNANPTPTYILAGNHDTRMGETALWYVHRGAARVMFPSSDLPKRFAPAPWVPSRTAESVVRESLSQHRGADTLVGHIGLYEGKAPPWLAGDPWFLSVHKMAGLVRKSGIKTVVCGHGHRWLDVEIDGVRIIQVGSLNPTSRSEMGGDFGNVVILEGKKVSLERNAIPGIRFVESSEDAVPSCWSIVPSDVTDDPPELWSAAYGSVTRVAFDRGGKGSSVDVRSDLAVRTSIGQAIMGAIRRGGLEGPRLGLVAEAIGRLHGEYGIHDAVSPWDKISQSTFDW